MKKVLVVGAGPVGLSAAFFLNRIKGVQVDIVEKIPFREEKIFSKALLVNARTLQIFEGTKIQKEIIEDSFQVSDINLYRGYDLAASNNITKALTGRTKFPFMTMYPQGLTEQVLERNLLEQGITVQRSCQVENVKDHQSYVEVSFLGKEPRKYDIVLATDGAKSSVRHSLGVRLEGETLTDKLYLCDAVLEGPKVGQNHIYIHPDLLFLMIPMKNSVRLIGTKPNYLDYLPKEYKCISKDWQSEFVVNNRTIPHMNYGNIYFAGDSAHVHAPIGGRGCNLGIQDAFVFSKLLEQGKLSEYHSERKPRVDGFVNQISNVSSVMISNKHPYIRALFSRVVGVVSPLLINQIARFVSGLDYDIPQIPRL